MPPGDGRYADRAYGSQDHRAQDSHRTHAFQHEHSFRGAADRRPQQHDYYRRDERRDDRYAGSGYRDDGYVRRDAQRDYPPASLPRQDFTFRVPAGPRWPAESASAHAPNPPPRRHQGKNRGPQKSRGPGNHRMNQNGGRRWPLPKPAHQRDLLTRAGRQTTPERLEGMGGSGSRFAEYISESDSEDEEQLSRKRVKVESDPAVSAPKWSNPDPYTALPPPESLGAPKKDIVQVIRKSKLEPQVKPADPAKANQDFISFNFDDSDDEEASDKDDDMSLGSAASVGDAPPPDAPRGPKSMTQFNTPSFTSINESKSSIATAPISEQQERSVPRQSEQASRTAAHPSTALPPVGQPLPTKAPAHTLPARPVHIDLETGVSIPDVGPRASKKRKHDLLSAGDTLPEWAVVPGSDSTPWFRAPATIYTASPAIRLHDEIHDFYNFVRPHDFEEDVRRDLIRHFERLLRSSNVPNATNVTLECFGSFAAGLYLPTADLDLVALSPAFSYNGRKTFCQTPGHMRRLSSDLQRMDRGIRNMVVLARTRVPIIKFTEQSTGIHVDISFENDSGILANKTFQEWKERYPMMPILVVMIKQLVKMYGLNEVHTGGIGGFTIICLVVSMLQLLPQSQAGYATKPGDLLLHFLDLYGNKFNVWSTGINMEPPGYFNKIDDPMPRQNDNGLTIRDPNNPMNDISGGSKKIEQVLEVFRKAHSRLQGRLAQVQADHRDQQSLLGCILAANYTSFMEQRARLYEARFDAPMPPHVELKSVPQSHMPIAVPQVAGSQPDHSTGGRDPGASTLASTPASASAGPRANPVALQPLQESKGIQKQRKLAEDFQRAFPHIDLELRSRLTMFEAGQLLQKHGVGDRGGSALAELISADMKKRQKKLQKKPGKKSELAQAEKRKKKAEKKLAKREAKQKEVVQKARAKDETTKKTRLRQSTQPNQPTESGGGRRKAKKRAQGAQQAKGQNKPGIEGRLQSAVNNGALAPVPTHQAQSARRSTRLNGAATSA